MKEGHVRGRHDEPFAGVGRDVHRVERNSGHNFALASPSQSSRAPTPIEDK